ncbi:MAG: energy transducer TonB [Ignavibacteriaceae bacterium]|nr:energy transducer TonB [Ignavibacteriaceae bacterium]
MKTKSIVLFLIFILLAAIKMEAKNVLPGGEEEYLPMAEVMPEPVDGMAGIVKKITYPAIAKSAGMEGRVIAMAFINESGGVDDVKIIKGLGGGCNEEVEKVLRTSKFKPGINEGKPVKVKLTMSFVFKK